MFTRLIFCLTVFGILPATALAESSRHCHRFPQYARLVDAAASRSGIIPPELIHEIIASESNGNPKARGAQGEIGLMQLTPATADFVTKKILKLPAKAEFNPWNPAHNIVAGVAYLDWLARRYQGDLRLAVIAYNWGPKNADRIKNRRETARLPRVTFRYVTHVFERETSLKRQKAVLIAHVSPSPRNWEAGGYAYVRLHRGDTVWNIAKCYTGNPDNFRLDAIQVVSGADIRNTVEKTERNYSRLPVGHLVRIESHLLRRFTHNRESNAL